MKRALPAMGLIGLSLLFLWSAQSAGPGDRFWPQWRGPLATGVAPFADPPTEWSETKNVKWKTEIPGKGSATPVVWGDKIFVLSAVPTDKPAPAKADSTPAPEEGGQRRRGPGGIQPTHVQQFVVLAINRRDGGILWKKVVREELPHEGTHPTGTWASPSAVTDGQHLWAHFGSRGLYCLDMRGNVKWEKDLGDMTVKLGFGEGSSPALHGDRLVLLWDHEGDSFIVALDKMTGNELWRTPRQEKTTWSTPLVVEDGGKAQVITAATNNVRSYDLATGKLLWEGPGLTPNSIPTPVYGDGMVYVTAGFRGNALFAIKLAAVKGNIAADSDAIVWKYDRDTPYVPSPLLYEDKLYFLKSNNGILSCFNARTGEKLYGEQRVESVPNVYASLVGAAGRVYVTGREGAVAVIQHGPEYKLLATNTLQDGFDASPALVGGEIYLRGKKYLYRISKN